MARILVGEPNSKSADQVAAALNFHRHDVVTCRTADEVLNELEASEFDLLVLDRMLPDDSGIEICRRYRSQGGVSPVLLVSEHARLYDKICSFEAGADDYLAKPFAMKELHVRVDALLRRSMNGTPTLTAGDITMDLSRNKVYRMQQSIKLTPRQFRLLEFFMQHPNRTFSSEAILKNVWPSKTSATGLAVRTTIKRLRTALDPESRVFKTIHGAGYMLIK
jgi:DNA-binding response OmpR family regulator